MNNQTLQTANKINKDLNEFERALECFETTIGDSEEKHSTSPKLIIDFDDFDDGRTQIALPMNLSDHMIGILKQNIIENIERMKKEFEEL